MTVEKKSILGDGNLVVGIIALVFGLWMSVYFKTSKGIYPLIIFGLMVFLGALLIIFSISGKSKASVPGKISIREAVVMLLLFATPLSAKTVGFYLSGTLAIYLIMQLFSPSRNVKQLIKTAVYSICTGAAVYVVFTVLLKINTPKGFLI